MNQEVKKPVPHRLVSGSGMITAQVEIRSKDGTLKYKGPLEMPIVGVGVPAKGEKK